MHPIILLRSEFIFPVFDVYSLSCLCCVQNHLARLLLRALYSCAPDVLLTHRSRSHRHQVLSAIHIQCIWRIDIRRSHPSLERLDTTRFWGSYCVYRLNYNTQWPFCTSKSSGKSYFNNSNIIVSSLLFLSFFLPFAGKNDKSIFVRTRHGSHLAFFEGGLIIPNRLSWMDRLAAQYFHALLDTRKS